MSVINQVLVELEKRRASGAERGILPDHVRALPEGGSDHRAWWFAAAGGAALVLAGVVWVALSAFGWAPRATVAAVERAGPDAVVERFVSASAAMAADVTPREHAVRRSGDTPHPAGHLTLELSTVPKEQAPRSTATRIAEKPVTAGKRGIEKQIPQATARELSDNEYRKAAGSLHQGRTQEAMAGFREALNLFPGHHGARQGLVALLVESKAGSEAERVLQEGIKLAPEQIGFTMTLARLQVDRGDGSGAAATLQGGLAHAQASPDYVAFLAALLQRQGRHDQAVEQFQAALKARPGTGVWWLGLAISLQALNRGPEAQDAYRRARTTNNLNAELAAFADQRLRQLQ